MTSITFEFLNYLCRNNDHSNLNKIMQRYPHCKTMTNHNDETLMDVSISMKYAHDIISVLIENGMFYYYNDTNDRETMNWTTIGNTLPSKATEVVPISKIMPSWHTFDESKLITTVW